MIRIGYACINTRLPSPNRTCRLKNASENRLLALIRENLSRLETILEWNISHGVRLFRISSDTVPFGSHPVNTLKWWKILEPELDHLSELIIKNGLRVSMHPGQYTVLNSPRSTVVENAIADLRYHSRLLESLQLNESHKIILHVGGGYGDKLKSIHRFCKNFSRLPGRIQQRLAVENDEKTYSLSDVLEVSKQVNVPVIFDLFHHACNPSMTDLPLIEQILAVGKTWGKMDGRQKLHFSSQAPGKPTGAHSDGIGADLFKKTFLPVSHLPLDVMLETKDKERSVLSLMKKIPEFFTPKIRD